MLNLRLRHSIVQRIIAFILSLRELFVFVFEFENMRRGALFWRKFSLQISFTSTEISAALSIEIPSPVCHWHLQLRKKNMFQKPYNFYLNQYKVHHYEITTLTTLCNSKYDLPEHLDATNNILFVDANNLVFFLWSE